MQPNLIIGILLVVIIVTIGLSIWFFTAYARLSTHQYLSWRIKNGMKVNAEGDGAA